MGGVISLANNQKFENDRFLLEKLWKVKRTTHLLSFPYHPPIILPYASLTSPFGKRK